MQPTKNSKINSYKVFIKNLKIKKLKPKIIMQDLVFLGFKVNFFFKT